MSITLSIRTLLKDSNRNYNMNELKTVGCNGIVINTGLKNHITAQQKVFIHHYNVINAYYTLKSYHSINKSVLCVYFKHKRVDLSKPEFVISQKIK